MQGLILYSEALQWCRKALFQNRAAYFEGALLRTPEEKLGQVCCGQMDAYTDDWGIPPEIEKAAKKAIEELK